MWDILISVQCVDSLTSLVKLMKNSSLNTGPLLHSLVKGSFLGTRLPSYLEQRKSLSNVCFIGKVSKEEAEVLILVFEC